MVKRPDMRSYFRAKIDAHVNGGGWNRIPNLPPGVAKVSGDVTDRLIVVTMRDGTEWQWSGGRYAARKVNLCYAPLMPTPTEAGAVTPKYAPGHTEHTDDCMSEWGENARRVMTPQTIACNHRLHLADHYEFVCSLADCGWATDESHLTCPDHGFRVPTDRP